VSTSTITSGTEETEDTKKSTTGGTEKTVDTEKIKQQEDGRQKKTGVNAVLRTGSGARGY